MRKVSNLPNFQLKTYEIISHIELNSSPVNPSLSPDLKNTDSSPTRVLSDFDKLTNPAQSPTGRGKSKSGTALVVALLTGV